MAMAVVMVEKKAGCPTACTAIQLNTQHHHEYRTHRDTDARLHRLPRVAWLQTPGTIPGTVPGSLPGTLFYANNV